MIFSTTRTIRRFNCVYLLLLLCCFHDDTSCIRHCCFAFQSTRSNDVSTTRKLSSTTSTTLLRVSELHVPGYAQSKLPFILTEEDLHKLGTTTTASTSSSTTTTTTTTNTMPNNYDNDPYQQQYNQYYRNNNNNQQNTASATSTNAMTRTKPETTTYQIQERTYKPNCDYESLIPYDDGYLLHKTTTQIFTSDECQNIIDEAEYIASLVEWTTNRHGNYPTTDLPLVELPQTLQFLKLALVERIYPLLVSQFGQYLPDPTKLRLADGFVVKYDAERGQKELKPHRDGSVLSFNIALNPATEFDGGGTWFASLDDAVKIDQGQIVTHASALLHGG